MTNVNTERVIDYLRELADVNFQKKVWFASSGEVSSLIEAKCRLFVDSGLDTAFEKGEVAFTTEIDALLQRLETEVISVDALQAPAKLIVDPKMIPIRNLAAEVLRAINELK